MVETGSIHFLWFLPNMLSSVQSELKNERKVIRIFQPSFLNCKRNSDWDVLKWNPKKVLRGSEGKSAC